MLLTLSPNLPKLFYRLNPIDERLCCELDETNDQRLAEAQMAANEIVSAPVEWKRLVAAAHALKSGTLGDARS